MVPLLVFGKGTTVTRFHPSDQDFAAVSLPVLFVVLLGTMTGAVP